jgi:hypothetical protein
MKKHSFFLIVALVGLFMLTGCADKEVMQCQPPAGHQYGFWGGLWHGLIVGFDFVGMLIWDDVAVYAPNNNGTWYAFGFSLGCGGFGTFIGRARSRWEKETEE